MSYRRNYRRRHYRRNRRGYSYTFDPVKGIFLIGTAFILLGSLSAIASFHYWGVIFGIIIWLVILATIVYVIRKIKSGPKKIVFGGTDIRDESDISQLSEINSEKHGCKCYMEGLTDGEREIAHILAENLSYKDYFIFNNLTIPSNHNGSSQIDHLVVSRFGIFVIESKDYKGWIFGNENEEQWTQSLPGGRNKFQFQNPIRQNWSHIMALGTLMPFIPKDAFQSIVVFTDSCEIKTPAIENVVRAEDLINCIKKYAGDKLPENDLQMALGKLSYACQTLDISLSEHIENLQLYHP